MSVTENPTPSTPAARSVRLTAAAVLAAVEGLAIAAAGLYMIGLVLFGHPASVQEALMGGATVLALAALPLSAAYGLLRARRWSRGPALIIQLMALPCAWTMAHYGTALLAGGVVLGAVALAELALLVHPAATEALGIRRTAA
ncbi:hypothetical protein K7472_25730 [Streptomyces sp. PTM05]|uniref:Integral membrane protein n=1 Tax=Streptantibioticus parmotrematis TaxID=2873249 RepID=A0ABS7QZ46_9ACTN|nr:hypothetical protein [Streptantibioticus parmotrematis]MBY8888213.1 hypothetical protein [Streptantibioticus parmotrematis]